MLVLLRPRQLFAQGTYKDQDPFGKHESRSHYFEIEIVDPGSSCYIAIGLARKDYPRNRHPGWNKGR